MPFSPLVERALRVAARAHREHCRKASDIPYITHPAGVALLLVQSGFSDEHILAAALLHDVVEDTDWTAEDLAGEFPESVVKSVALLTERKRDEEGRPRKWRDRKEDHLAQIEQAPVEVRAIVLADKLHNLGTMLFDLECGEPLWPRFHAPPEEIIWYHRRMIEVASQGDPQLETLAAACTAHVDRLESTVAEKL